ncbi:MAG: hypothetical protein RQ758_00160 [Methanomicrobiaceae archaeon]|nr:hypothetical protein [Methanomicrobiaceae archaeon]
MQRTPGAEARSCRWGDVHHLPPCSATIDLVVSRGSIYFGRIMPGHSGK